MVEVSPLGLELAGRERVAAVIAETGRGLSALVPGVQGNVDRLINLGGDVDLVRRALASAAATWFLLRHRIVKHEEVVVMPVGVVVVDPEHVTLLVHVTDGDVEVAIFHVLLQVHLLLEFGGPLGAVVAPVALEAFFAPGVAHLDEPIASAESLHADNSVGMAVREAILMLHIVVAFTRSACLNDGIFGISFDKLVPEIFHREIYSIDLFPGATKYGAGSIGGVTTLNTVVGTPVLGEGLLEDRAPHGVVITILGKVGVAIPGRDLVIDDNGVGDTERVEVDGVDTIVLAEITLIAEEDLLHAVSLLSDGRDSGHEPAVADRALDDIVERDTITEERLALEAFSGDTSPLKLFPLFLHLLAHVCVGKRSSGSGEISVGELRRGLPEGPEVGDIPLVALHIDVARSGRCGALCGELSEGGVAVGPDLPDFRLGEGIGGLHNFSVGELHLRVARSAKVQFLVSKGIPHLGHARQSHGGNASNRECLVHG